MYHYFIASNIAETQSTILSHKLYWDDAADMRSFSERFSQKFDVLIAADVIYEAEQVQPLINTVKGIHVNINGCLFICIILI